MTVDATHASRKRDARPVMPDTLVLADSARFSRVTGISRRRHHIAQRGQDAGPAPSGHASPTNASAKASHEPPRTADRPPSRQQTVPHLRPVWNRSDPDLAMVSIPPTDGQPLFHVSPPWNNHVPSWWRRPNGRGWTRPYG